MVAASPSCTLPKQTPSTGQQQQYVTSLCITQAHTRQLLLLVLANVHPAGLSLLLALLAMGSAVPHDCSRTPGMLQAYTPHTAVLLTAYTIKPRLSMTCAGLLATAVS